jgi:DNA-directed RNA polymerase specialized sigma24 family protein
MATFEELYRQHVQAVFRFALSVAGKRDVAEDLTSEAFLALHRKQVHRVCLALRYVQGMTRAEIAARTGLTEMQVKGHLQYALTLLRKAHGVQET